MLRDLRSRTLLEGTDDPDGLVFLNPYGRRLDPKFVRDRLRDLCKEAGVPTISPHKARHTAATLALGATGDLGAVQRMLGHAQISLTANFVRIRHRRGPATRRPRARGAYRSRKLIQVQSYDGLDRCSADRDREKEAP